MCNKININLKGFIFAYFHYFLSNAAIIYICYFISYATHILLDLNKYTKRMFSLYLDETVYCLAVYKKWNQVKFFQQSYVLTLSSLQTNTDTLANSAVPDEMPHNEPSHQDLHCLLLCHWFLTEKPI